MTNKKRLIGDFLELNSDIVYEQRHSKYKDFIAKRIAKYRRYKLIKSANKLRKSNMILTPFNMAELIIYVDSVKDGTFGNIIKTKSLPTYVEAVVKFNNDNVTACILIREYESSFASIHIKEKVNGKDDITWTLDVTELDAEKYSNNIRKVSNNDVVAVSVEKCVKDLNKVLLDNIVDYIVYTISAYNRS